MEGPGKPRLYSPPFNRPTSPPATPGSQPRPPFPPTASNTSPSYKRMGFAMLAHSPPLEHIEPTGDGRFKYTRPRSADLSSCASTPSAFPQQCSREQSEERSLCSDDGRRVTTCAIEDADFILEELGTESEYSETEVVLPDKLEEATSEIAADEQLEADTNIIRTFSKLNCGDGSDSEDEQTRRYRQKKKRWSAGLFKRSHSQSVGSDSDMDDEALDAHDVGSSARRLRRRVKGPGDRSSLIFEDLPDHLEVEEPDDGGANRPPSLPSDDGFSLEDFPFWDLYEPMETESNSSRPASRG